LSDRVQKAPETAPDIFVPRTKQGQSREALTYKKHGKILQVKILSRHFTISAGINVLLRDCEISG
jgi:hypothetical protein